jgi:hypothetical protein
MYIIENALIALEELEAKEDLRAIKNGSFSSLKKEDREKVLKDLKKRADPESMKPKAVTSADLARLLGRAP